MCRFFFMNGGVLSRIELVYMLALVVAVMHVDGNEATAHQRHLKSPPPQVLLYQLLQTDASTAVGGVDGVSHAHLPLSLHHTLMTRPLSPLPGGFIESCELVTQR
jgi:hypothetical protein